MASLSFALAVPAYRDSVHTGHLYQLGSLVTFTHVNNIKMAVVTCGSCSVDWARNYLLWQSIKTGVAWCLMCDADNFTGNAPAIMDMIAEGTRRGAAAIAAPVKMRHRPGFNVVDIAADGTERLMDEAEVKGQVRPVSRIGSAFMAIRCGWIVKNWPTMPWFRNVLLPADVNSKDPPPRIGEDYFFCDGVRKRGGLILCDGRLDLAHAEATSETAVLVNDLNATVHETFPSLMAG